MPAVSVQRRPAPDAFLLEPSLDRDAARRLISSRMLKFEPVEPCFAERPGRQRRDRSGADSTAACGRHHPVGDVSLTVRQVQRLQGESTQQRVTVGVDHRPVTGALVQPTVLPPLDPLPRLVHGISPSHMPALNRRILERLHQVRGIGVQPRTQQHITRDRQSWLVGRAKRSRGDCRSDQGRHDQHYPRSLPSPANASGGCRHVRRHTPPAGL
ncbi:MAG: hypothetical protein QOH50_2240 [Kribbellaceae bacterium]|jgi:hypothetical protein|nr:hypothetical protein [Kribbellaceae bacterium]